MLSVASPRPRGPHGDAFPSATHRCHPELVVLEGAATCGNLTGPLRDGYGTIGELLQEFITAVSLRELIMVRESWLIQCDFDVGVAFRPRFWYPSGTFRYTCFFTLPRE